MIKLLNWLKPKHKPLIEVVESDGQIFVYKDKDLIIKTIVFPLRDKAMIEKVSNLYKLIK